MRINEAVVANTNIKLETNRPQKVEHAQQKDPPAEPTKVKVQPEEILNKIKELTDNGTYSIHFELNKEIDDLVINVVDKDTGEVVRQIPSEEIINATRAMKDYQDLRGLIVHAET